jgi:predicted MFS family arabinose efflux permease
MTFTLSKRLSTGVRTFCESLSLLASHRFGTFWFASLLSSIGTWAQQIAEPWLLLTIGASPFVIGLDSFVMDAPSWLLTFAGGALADRGDRRRVIAVFQSIQMLCPAAIVVLVLAHVVQPWMVVALSTVVGVTDALSMPSFQSIAPSIVAHEQVGQALALNSTQFNLSRIIGPAIAGLLISSIGVNACFVVNTASYLPFIGIALWILPRTARKATATSPFHPSPSGARAILSQRHLRGALLTVFTTGLFCAPLIMFVPVLVRTAFRGGAMSFSVALVAFGAGGLLGGAILLALPKGVDPRRLSSAFALLLAILVAAAAINRRAWALPALLFASGASITMSNTMANTLIQSTAPQSLLGRTVSLYMLALRGGGALGSLLTGVAVSAFGVRSALLLDGAVAVIAQAAIARIWLGQPLPSQEPR